MILTAVVDKHTDNELLHMAAANEHTDSSTSISISFHILNAYNHQLH